jgi:hypothetical protein
MVGNVANGLNKLGKKRMCDEQAISQKDENEIMV